MKTLFGLLCPLVLYAQSQTPPPPQRQTVVVTGVAAPLPLEELDRSVNVMGDLPKEQILFGGLQNLLQLDSSIDLQERAPGVQSDISIRGGTFGQTLVLVDGLRVNDAQSGHHNFDVPVPLEAMSHIEVLRGTGSTLYGSDAIGGVVNVLTRVDPEPALVLQAAGGSFGTNSQGGRFSFSQGPVSQQFSFERELSDGFEDDREYRNLAGSSETLLHTRLGVTRLFFSGLDRPFGANNFYGNYNSWERTKTWYAALSQALGENTLFTFSFRRHTDLFELFRDQPTLDANRHSDEAWDVTLRRHNDLSRSVRLSYGAEGFYDSIESTNLGYHHRRQGAGYGVLDFRALRRFSLSLGAREEFFGHHQTFFAPTVSGGVWLAGSLKLRGSVSRAFRRPTYTDLYYHDPADIGNPDLKPEEAMNYEAGADWYFHPKWRATATVFDRDEKNGIDYVRASPANPWIATNFDAIRFLGFESAITGSLPYGQTASVQYTALHGSQALAAGEQSEYLFNYPVNEAIATWQIFSEHGFLARTRVGVLDRYRQNAYALWDVNIGWNRSRFHPYLQLANVTNTRYQEITGVDMPGRSVTVGIEIFCPLPRSPLW
ncbi:MAG TPA: TonB-dependent receptor [Bryobacteraceae bacterium]|nr:TonB-dependent receptor [Bryobacteraceae bacterium]